MTWGLPFLADAAYNWNVIIFSLEIVTMIIAIAMIVVGLMQQKKAQTGLSALSGGSEELFISTKERGLDKTLSRVMLILGTIILIVTLVIILLTNNGLKPS